MSKMSEMHDDISQQLTDLITELEHIKYSVEDNGWHMDHYDELEGQSGRIPAIMELLKKANPLGSEFDIAPVAPPEKEVGKAYEYNCYGEIWQVEFVETEYHDGKFALQLVMAEDREMVAMCSVNTDEPTEKDCFFVKGWSENEGMERFLIDTGVASPTGRSTICGFSMADEFKMNRPGAAS
jgi:hypothetical protein